MKKDFSGLPGEYTASGFHRYPRSEQHKADNGFAFLVGFLIFLIFCGLILIWIL